MRHLATQDLKEGRLDCALRSSQQGLCAALFNIVPRTNVVSRLAAASAIYPAVLTSHGFAVFVKRG